MRIAALVTSQETVELEALTLTQDYLQVVAFHSDLAVLMVAYLLASPAEELKQLVLSETSVPS
jgi:hypothetical protein